LPAEAPPPEKARRRIARLEKTAAELRDWLMSNPEDRRGAKGSVRQSNRTDNESAKLATGKGVLQGYTGATAVDAKHQIIVEAQAYGTGSEQEVLLPVVDAMRESALLTADSLITADAGYHSKANLRALAEREVDALIADNGMRRRDERFAEQARHKAKKDPLHDKSSAREKARELPLYEPADFTYDPVARTCKCPAGKSLYRKGQNLVIGNYVGEEFRGAKRDCVPCGHRARCLRHPDRTPVRTVVFFHGRSERSRARGVDLAQQMRERLDSAEGRSLYAMRFGAVEPVFGTICHNKGLRRFTLRGRTKVDAQWKLFCLVHNIEKLAKLRYAA
jgi:hypothetical protein